MNRQKIRPNWKTLIQIPRRASGHFDQNLSVLDVGHVFPTRQRLTETAVRCGARVHPPPETPLQDVVGSAVAAPPNARSQIACHFGCVNGMRGLAGCMHALFFRWPKKTYFSADHNCQSAVWRPKIESRRQMLPHSDRHFERQKFIVLVHSACFRTQSRWIVDGWFSEWEQERSCLPLNCMH